MIKSEDKNKYFGTCSSRCVNTILARRGAEKKKLKSRSKKICHICKTEFEVCDWQINQSKNPDYMTCGSKECYSKSMRIINLERYDKKPELMIMNDYEDQIQHPMYLNHKVKSVTLVEGLHDTGDITIEKYHNFATESGVFVHNSQKSTLSEENVLFARLIISYQKDLGMHVNELIQKIVEEVGDEDLLATVEDAKVNFATPKSLQFERQSKYITDLVNLVESLERIGVPKEYSRKKYLTDIDWADLKHYETDETIDKKIGAAQNDQDQMGGMGMGGGMPTY